MENKAVWKLMPNARMTDHKTTRGGRDDQIGKVFFAVRSDLRQCFVCGELFSRQAAAQHADVDCSSFFELSMVYLRTGGQDVA